MSYAESGCKTSSVSVERFHTVCEAEKGKIREDHDKFKYILKMS